VQRTRHFPLLAVLLTYLALGAAYALRVPAWQAPDEPGHYNHVAALARGQWPVIEPSDWDPTVIPVPPDALRVEVDKIRYQDHQPPLFYALSVPVFALSGGSLPVLRLWSLLIGMIGVVACYASVLTLFPGRVGLSAVAAVLYALLPQHLHVLGSFNNDALSEALLGLTVWQSLRLFAPQTSSWRFAPALLALTVGLAMWTKAQAYLALPVSVMALWLCAPNARAGLTRALGCAVPAMLIAAPLWARNIAVYGGLDFLALQAHNRAVTGQLSTAFLITTLGWPSYLYEAGRVTFQSYWGQFGWMSVLPGARVYQALLAFTVLSGALFLRWWVRQRVELHVSQRMALLLLAALALMSALAYGWYNTQFVQFQGRYLYTALIPVATAFALGWDAAVRSQRWLWPAMLMAMAGLNVYMLLRVIGPGFGLP
jgi:4-amino-4-deoxy-L-arabinose transferase-like glycosyltransferase